MSKHRWASAAVACVLAPAAMGCGKAQNQGPASAGKAPATAQSQLQLSPDTPTATGQAGSVTWATYRPVQTIDPIQAFDYPDNTAVTLLCESLLRQQPDGSVTAGVAQATHPDDRTLVLKINPAATFWDGKKVTAQDVVFGLKRNTDPKLGGFYGQVFDRVASITATGQDEVTIALKRPDYWLDGELSSMAGVVVEKAYVEQQGKRFGSPDGGTMCTGAHKLKSWAGGDALVAARNDGYWGERKPMVGRIELRGVPDESNLTSGLQTGEIDGYYAPGPLNTAKQITASGKASVYQGPSFSTDAFVVSATSGPLASAKVRQAVSMAIDRRADVANGYQDSALLPRTLANPGTWGYGREVFQADWNALPDPKFDVAGAKAIVRQAGVAGKTITIGTSQEIPPIATAAQVIANAAKSIGLKVRLRSVSAANWINFFIDPKASHSVDGFPTVNYPDYADPAAFYKQVALPGAVQNFSGYDNRDVTHLLDQARATARPEARAKLVAKAGDILARDLPWIPVVAPKTVLAMSNKITGAPASFSYMGGPWADTLGAKG